MWPVVGADVKRRGGGKLMCEDSFVATPLRWGVAFCYLVVISRRHGPVALITRANVPESISTVPV